MPNAPLKEINGHKIIAFDDPNGPWGILSNSAPIKDFAMKTQFGMKIFPSVEHYLQYLRKPYDQVWMVQIQHEADVKKVQEKGAKFFAGLSPTAATKHKVDWLAAIEEKLNDAIDAKLAKSKEFAKALEDTQDAFLVADTSLRDESLQDDNLGWKSGHRVNSITNLRTQGNQLGIILMEKRNAIHYKNNNDFIVGATTQLSKTIRKFLEKNYPYDNITTLIQKNPDLAYVKQTQAPAAKPETPDAMTDETSKPPSRPLPAVKPLATSTIVPQPKPLPAKPQSSKSLEEKEKEKPAHPKKPATATAKPKTAAQPLSNISKWNSLAAYNPFGRAPRKKSAAVKPAPAKTAQATQPKQATPAPKPVQAKSVSTTAKPRPAKPTTPVRRLSSQTAKPLVRKTEVAKPAASTTPITPSPTLPATNTHAKPKSHKTLFSTPPAETKTSSTHRPTISTVAPRAGNQISGFNSRPNIKKILTSLNAEDKERNWEQKSVDPTTKDVVLADKDNHTFTVHDKLISTTDETLETFKAMLLGYQAVSPNTKPKITFTEARLEQTWKDACAATNIKAELVYKPSANPPPDEPAPSSRPSP
jgi:hypothetical protein